MDISEQPWSQPRRAKEWPGTAGSATTARPGANPRVTVSPSESTTHGGWNESSLTSNGHRDSARPHRARCCASPSDTWRPAVDDPAYSGRGGSALSTYTVVVRCKSRCRGARDLEALSAPVALP